MTGVDALVHRIDQELEGDVERQKAALAERKPLEESLG